jgi:nucleoside-diphosphate-sugar epimerase
VYEPFPDGLLTEATRDGYRSWTYVQTKLDIEAQVLEAARSGRVRGTIVQPSVVYGPFGKSWTNDPAEMLIYGEVILPDRGEGYCNAIYVDDLVDGLILAGTHPAAVGERFIMSGPDPVTWSVFFGAFAHALNVPGPSFLPADEIARSNHGVLHDVRLVLSNPKRLIQIIVRWPPARHALQSGLDAMPKAARDIVNRVYFGEGARQIGEVFLPDRQKLGLYRAKAVATSDKAHRLLGYAPRHDFRAGMALTSRYLTWAYGDLAISAPPRPRMTPSAAAAAADLANAR